MFERLAYLRKRLFTGIWFIPIALCAASFMLGVLMLGLDRHMTSLFSGMRMFALPVDSDRQVLSVIAGSVISVGGVCFSVTMVALTLTSGQYGPKVAAGLLKRGVIARAMPQGDILGFAPPLCLSRDEADIVVAAMREAVEEVFAGA